MNEGLVLNCAPPKVVGQNKAARNENCTEKLNYEGVANLQNYIKAKNFYRP
jgi:hypothetical protein